MRILVAGGCGLIGSHLVAFLVERGIEVVVLDNLSTGSIQNLPGARGSDKLRFVRGDICRPPALPGRFDAIVNLASPASPRDYHALPIATLEAGSRGTQNLLDLALRDRAQFLLASTSEVYGDPEVHPQTESYWGRVNPVGPRSVYDEAKRFSEAITTAYGCHKRIRVRIARIFNTYGPNMRLDDGRVIPTFIVQALRGEPLTVQGDGSQTRSYCYVEDLVAGLDALLWGEVEGPVNLGNPEEYSILDTARIVLDLTGSASPLRHCDLPEDDPHVRCPDITRARRELGWEPRVRFAEGLALTIASFRRRLAEGRHDALEVPRGQIPGAMAHVRARMFSLPQVVLTWLGRS